MIVSGLNACYPRVLLQEVSPARDKCRWRFLSRARKPSVRGVLMWEMAWSDKREGERAHARLSTSS